MLDRLDEISKRAADATDGPWRWFNRNTLVGDHGHRPVVITANGFLQIRHKESGLLIENTPSYADPQFIVHSRQDIPWLLKQIKKRDTVLRDAECELKKYTCPLFCGLGTYLCDKCKFLKQIKDAMNE